MVTESSYLESSYLGWSTFYFGFTSITYYTDTKSIPRGKILLCLKIIKLITTWERNIFTPLFLTSVYNCSYSFLTYRLTVHRGIRFCCSLWLIYRQSNQTFSIIQTWCIFSELLIFTLYSWLLHIHYTLITTHSTYEYFISWHTSFTRKTETCTIQRIL